MHNSRLLRSALATTTRMIRDDNFDHVRIFRGRRGSETQVMEFTTRIAPTNSARDQQTVSGDAAPQLYVFSAPRGSNINKGDEAWTDSARYRVIAVDATPGAQQVIAHPIQ